MIASDSPHRTSTPSLPSELWFLIFRWATWPPPNLAYSSDYLPFELEEVPDFDEILRTKRALVGVCKMWNELTLELLYEDVRVRHGTDVKARWQLPVSESVEGDDDSSPKTGLGKWVRCARIVPLASDSTHSILKDRQGPVPIHPLDKGSILSSFSSLEILVRPVLEPATFRPCSGLCDLPCLKRVDWCQHHWASDEVDWLWHVLNRAPDMRYLSLGVHCLWHNQPWPALHLPALETLHLRTVTGPLLAHICRSTLPTLRHVIIGSSSNNGALFNLLRQYGAQLLTWEFGHHLHFYMNDYIPAVMRYCPQLEELSFYIYFTATPKLSFTHPSVTCVRMHARVNQMVTDPVVKWRHIRDHFVFLTAGSAFPGLRQIVLHGDWDEITSDRQFEPLHRSVQDRNCSLEYPDGTLVTIP